MRALAHKSWEIKLLIFYKKFNSIGQILSGTGILEQILDKIAACFDKPNYIGFHHNSGSKILVFTENCK